MDIILASTSAIRRRLLHSAGIPFRAITPTVDEALLKTTAGNLTPGATAEYLARSKAKSLQVTQGTIVIGADQVLSIGNDILSKPSNLAEARNQLLRLRGNSHHLHSAVACVNDQGKVWSHIAQATLTVRRFTDGFLDWYLDQAGNDILNAVGSYKLEEHGAHLFDAIDGDYFTVLGLPLLPLLSQLRAWKAILA